MAKKQTQVEFHFKRPGRTTGAVSGEPRRYRRGQVIVADAKEFAHVNAGHYEIRPYTPAAASAKPAPEAEEAEEEAEG